MDGNAASTAESSSSRDGAAVALRPLVAESQVGAAQLNWSSLLPVGWESQKIQGVEEHFVFCFSIFLDLSLFPPLGDLVLEN